MLLKYKAHHVLFWLALGAVWFYLRYQDYSTSHRALLVTVIKVTDLAVLTYIANYVLIPTFLYHKRYWQFTILLLLMVACSSILKMYVIGTVINNPALYQWTNSLKARIYDNVIPHFFLVVAGMAFKLLLDHNRMQKNLLEIARQKAETELSFLKSQINPHFLFNSLNAVYFLIDKNNNEARMALHTFSEMLRYQLYKVKDEKIAIEKEIAYLQDYIRLQQLGMENCDIRVNIEPSVKGIFIEPLLLLPFVENAFKHLSHFTDGKSNAIALNLQLQHNDLFFGIENTTEERHEEGSTGGIGLVNVKRRLELLYPHKHELLIKEKENWFCVTLKLKL